MEERPRPVGTFSAPEGSRSRSRSIRLCLGRSASSAGLYASQVSDIPRVWRCGTVVEVRDPRGLEVGAKITADALGFRRAVRWPDRARTNTERPQQTGEHALRQLARLRPHRIGGTKADQFRDQLAAGDASD